jgi:hypothetical protein
MDLEKQEMANRIKRMVRKEERRDELIADIIGTALIVFSAGLVFGIRMGIICGVISYWSYLIFCELKRRNDDVYGC